MKYLIYADDSRLDVFFPLVDHKKRAQSLFSEMGFTCQIKSAGTVRFTEDALDAFVVVHGSQSLGIDRDIEREKLDAEIIKNMLTFF